MRTYPTAASITTVYNEKKAESDAIVADWHRTGGGDYFDMEKLDAALATTYVWNLYKSAALNGEALDRDRSLVAAELAGSIFAILLEETSDPDMSMSVHAATLDAAEKVMEFDMYAR